MNPPGSIGAPETADEAAPEAPPEAPPETDKDKLSSCLGCRKRKLKCSRDVPSCSHCQRLDSPCVYDSKRSKPGLRPGAIESLNQRVEALENRLSQSDPEPRPAVSPPPASGSLSTTATTTTTNGQDIVGILALLARELQKLNGVPSSAAASAHGTRLAQQDDASCCSCSPTGYPPGFPPGFSFTGSPRPQSPLLSPYSSPSSTNPLKRRRHHSPHRTSSHSHSGPHPYKCHRHARHQQKQHPPIDSCGNPHIDLAVPLEEVVGRTGGASSSRSGGVRYKSGGSGGNGGNGRSGGYIAAEDAVGHGGARLPAADLLEEVVDAYFVTVQPWIPLLHETQFRRRMHDAGRRPRLTGVLHAMVVAAGRYVTAPGLGAGVGDRNDMLDQMGSGQEADEGSRARPTGVQELADLAEQSRSYVLLRCMDSLSVENLQALVIIAFHDIGSGNASRAWSIIGSLTRTVEYLQLSVEDDRDDHLGFDLENSSQSHRNQNQPHSYDDQQPLLKPILSLTPPQDWTEEEERRRVFWNIFLLDRFCSITTGWNISLTADDVHRRLPADGFYFHKEEPVLTPYFGLWDRSVARLGNSIAFLPGGQYPSYPSTAAAAAASQQSHPISQPDQKSPSSIGMRDGGAGPTAVAAGTSESPASTGSHHNHVTNNHHSHQQRAGDMAHVGAFAYCIEATESLSQITTYFLQQRVDFHDRQQVSGWLTRFKELDLRLVHWKMFLPQRWKDSNISKQPALVEMDPNLTLAHVTHNTSMILLHQRIAFPPPLLSLRPLLPSVCSAETCQVAAVETATITDKYLRYTDPRSPVGNLFAFCVFVSARVLLIQWHWQTQAHGQGQQQQQHQQDPASTEEAAASEIAPEFWSLLGSLSIMDQRWLGASGPCMEPNEGQEAPLTTPYATTKTRRSLSGCYAQQLRQLYRKCVEQPDSALDVLGYTAVYEGQDEEENGKADMLDVMPGADVLDRQAPLAPGSGELPLSSLQTLIMSPQPQKDASPTSVPHWSMPSLDTMPPPSYPPTQTSPTAYGPTDDLSAISHLLLDQRFVDMDRVISFEDTFFSGQTRWS